MSDIGTSVRVSNQTFCSIALVVVGRGIVQDKIERADFHNLLLPTAGQILGFSLTSCLSIISLY